MSKVCCPIELEPRTLSEGQLSHAREEAADVVQKLEEKEASNLFSQTLEPVVPTKELDEGEENGDEHEDEVGGEDGCIKAKIIELPCQCSCINTDSPDQLVIKEPLSAPF